MYYFSSIIVVAVRHQLWARLVLGWMVVDRMAKASQYVTIHPCQLSLAIFLSVGAMSTSWDVNRCTMWVWCTSIISVVSQCKL